MRISLVEVLSFANAHTPFGKYILNTAFYWFLCYFQVHWLVFIVPFGTCLEFYLGAFF